MGTVQDSNQDRNPPAATPYEFKPSPYSSHTLVMRALPAHGEGRRVLDVGCAGGYLARRLAAQGYEVIGIERPGPVAADFPDHVRLVQADLDAGLPSLPEPFDFIICADILEHLRDPLQLLLDLHPRLAAGGRLIASLPNSGNLYFRLNVLLGQFPSRDRGLFDRTHLHFYTWTGWCNLFAHSGFKIERVMPTGVPVGLAWPKRDGTLLVRVLEKCA